MRISDWSSDVCSSDLPFEWVPGTWVGFDGSHSGDSSALVAVNPGGQLCVLGLWEKPTRLAGRVSDEWRVPRTDVERAVSAAMDQPCRPSLVADPPYCRTEQTGRDAGGERECQYV